MRYISDLDQGSNIREISKDNKRGEIRYQYVSKHLILSEYHILIDLLNNEPINISENDLQELLDEDHKFCQAIVEKDRYEFDEFNKILCGCSVIDRTVLI